MTFHFDNVYLEECATVCGPYEKKGPLSKWFDKSFKDLYFGEDTFEKAEIKAIRECFNLILKKSGYKKEDIDLVIGGDLSNQITASTYGSSEIGKGFVGIYSACSTSALGLFLAASLINVKYINNSLCLVSSHNLTSERQFRYPTEYGAPRVKSSTFTATGAAIGMLSNKRSAVRIESATVGRIVDYEQNDPNDMGRVMAPGAIDTLIRHFEDTERTADYYDLIVTGDLGKYGLDIVKDFVFKEYKIKLNNYNDCGVLLYDLTKQSDVHAGGSGPVCSGLVLYSYIYNMLKEKKLKRVLFLATGALFSPIMLFQKQNIYTICHAISLEAV